MGSGEESWKKKVQKKLLDYSSQKSPSFQQLHINEWTPCQVYPDDDRTINAIGIVTCNRTQLMERALLSYIDHCRSHGREPEYAIFDDTPTTQGRKANFNVLKKIKSRTGAVIHYGGREEKKRFAQALIKMGVAPQKAIHSAFGLSRNYNNPIGANRNALFLHHVGEMFISVDDDTICRPFLPKNSRRGMSIASGDPQEYQFHNSLEEALEAVNTGKTDFIAAHQSLLGRSLTDLISDLADKKPLYSTHSPIEALLKEGKGKVNVTINGLIGDCGWNVPSGYWGHPLGLFAMRGRSLQRLIMTEEFYQSASLSRIQSRSALSPAICNSILLMSGFLGFDARTTLPPFHPYFRGEDPVFGILLESCMEGMLFGHLPFMLPHSPEEIRKFSPGEVQRTATGFDFSRFLIAAVKSHEKRAEKDDNKEKMKKLGRHLQHLSTLEQGTLREIIWEQTFKDNGHFIAFLEDQVRLGGSKEFWKKDIRNYITLLETAMVSKDYIVPMDLLDKNDQQQGMSLILELLHDFGRLLEWWPEIFEGARILKEEGVRPGREVIL